MVSASSGQLVGVCPAIPYPVELPDLTVTGDTATVLTFSNLLDQPTDEATCSPPVPPSTKSFIGPMLSSTYGHNLLRTADTGRLFGSGTCTTGVKIGQACFSNADCSIPSTPGICTGGGGLLQKFGEFQGTGGSCADSNTSSCNIDVTPLFTCEPPSQVHTPHPLSFTDTSIPASHCQGDVLTTNLPCTTDPPCKQSPNSGGYCAGGIYYYLVAAFTDRGPGGTATHNMFNGSPAVLHTARTDAGLVPIPYALGVYVDPASATNCP
jgi:hypothetical protein